MGLPQSVRDLARRGFSPIEDIVLAVLRAGLSDVPVLSMIPSKMYVPQVFIRRNHGMGDWHGDYRFVDFARITVDTFTHDATGLEGGDLQGALLQEAIRQVLYQAQRTNWYDPSLGSIKTVRMVSEPSRVTDWATSAGPVQYADLPSEWTRYESTYKITIRKPR